MAEPFYIDDRQFADVAVTVRMHSALSSVLVLALCVGGSTVSATKWDVVRDMTEMVDGENMLSTVTDLQAFGSREFHLNSSWEAGDYVRSSFEDIGLEVEFQEFIVGTVRVRNVIAVIPGDGDYEEWFLFGAHYDSENMDASNLAEAEMLPAPGADDDASGVAVVMEIARILSTVGTSHPIKFVAFGAEEYGYDNTGGLKGSEYFVAQETEEGTNYIGTAIIDMVGYRSGYENKAVLVTNEDEHEFAIACDLAVDEMRIELNMDTVNDTHIVYSDHASFWSAGIPSMLVIEEFNPITYVPANPYYHTAQDTVDRLSVEQMTAVAQMLLGGFAHMTAEGESDHSPVIGVLAISASGAIAVAVLILRFNRGRCAK